jgi:hypothetical protein
MTDMRSRTVADLAGITYRQLDYLTRHPHSPLSRALNQGSGSRRDWSPRQVICIALANHLAGATVSDAPGNGSFVSYAFTLLRHNGPIPHNGWIACSTDPDGPLEIDFADSPTDLLTAIETMRAAVVAAYDLTEILGCSPDRLTHLYTPCPIPA